MQTLLFEFLECYYYIYCINSEKGVLLVNNLPTSVLADILSEKIKRDTSEEYRQFVNNINELAYQSDSLEALQHSVKHLESFLPHLDLVLSVTHDYDDIMNMKATLLDLFVNDLHYKSVYLLAHALLSNETLTHLQSFISPIQYWVTVIKSKEILEAA